MTLLHGHRMDKGKSPTYISWSQMRQRCLNPNHHKFPHYGGRGITVAPEWVDFRRFFIDMGPRPYGKTLDRRDFNGNYCKDNCQWANASQQNRNRRSNGCAGRTGRNATVSGDRIGATGDAGVATVTAV